MSRGKPTGRGEIGTTLSYVPSDGNTCLATLNWPIACMLEVDSERLLCMPAVLFGRINVHYAHATSTRIAAQRVL